MSPANSYVRLLGDVMRAEHAGQDLQEGPYGVHVFAKRKDGTLYELGSVSEDMVYQDRALALAAIDRIKFTRRDSQEVPYPLRHDDKPRAVWPAGLTHLHDLVLEGEEPDFVDTVRESDAKDSYYRRNYGDAR